jgi:hypothetical protein
VKPQGVIELTAGVQVGEAPERGITHSYNNQIAIIGAEKPNCFKVITPKHCYFFSATNQQL